MTIFIILWSIFCAGLGLVITNGFVQMIEDHL